jgi:hypothetical protein
VSPKSAVGSPRIVDPADVLFAIADELREGRTLISAHVVEPDAEPALGMLIAAGPRCRSAPGEYARVLESVREGYLLHYGAPRILDGLDRDLALLAGDYLYALGLERLTALADLPAIRELSDLISLCAQLHADDGAGQDGTAALWLASAIAIGAGAGEQHAPAKAGIRARTPGATEALRRQALSRAGAAGLADRFRRTSEAIESGAHHSS